jgi:predicted secreted protein
MAIQQNAVVRKDDVAARSVALALRAGTDVHLGDAQDCLTDYRNIRQIWKINPTTGLAWTLEDLDSLQIGQELVG